MNARQKAKYWKKKYQELASIPVPIKNVVSEREIETLKYTTVIDEIRLRQMSNNPEIQRVVFDEIADELTNLAKCFVDITTEKPPHTLGMKITGRLDIARPFRDDHDIYNTHWDVMHDKRENNGGMSNDK